jgi:aminoglycoside 2'-N-acetyltransferase I
MNNQHSSISLTHHANSSLTIPQQEEILAIMQKVFGAGFHPEDWAPVDWVTLLSIDDHIVSHVSITDRVCDVGGTAVRVGGIGGVATLPEFRQRGFAHRTMSASADFMRDQMRVDFGLLFCGFRMEPFYKSLGWQTIPARVFYNQPDRKILEDGLLMALPCTQTVWPQGVVDVCGLPW